MESIGENSFAYSRFALRHQRLTESAEGEEMGLRIWNHGVGVAVAVAVGVAVGIGVGVGVGLPGSIPLL